MPSASSIGLYHNWSVSKLSASALKEPNTQIYWNYLKACKLLKDNLKKILGWHVSYGWRVPTKMREGFENGQDWRQQYVNSPQTFLIWLKSKPKTLYTCVLSHLQYYLCFQIFKANCKQYQIMTKPKTVQHRLENGWGYMWRCNVSTMYWNFTILPCKCEKQRRSECLSCIIN